VSNFKDSTDQKACLLEIICNQIERGYWSEQVKGVPTTYHDPNIQGIRELISALSGRIQDQRKELGIDVRGW